MLFGVFAGCVLGVLLTGADAYQRLTDRGQETFDERTAAQYLTTRVRQADAAGGVFVAPLFPEQYEVTLFWRRTSTGSVISPGSIAGRAIFVNCSAGRRRTLPRRTGKGPGFAGPVSLPG